MIIDEQRVYTKEEGEEEHLTKEMKREKRGQLDRDVKRGETRV